MRIVKRMDCVKREEKSTQIFIPYKRSFSLVLWEEEWLVGGDPLLREILGLLAPVGTKSLDFASIFAHSVSALTPSKKVHLTLIGSPLHAFQWT